MTDDGRVESFSTWATLSALREQRVQGWTVPLIQHIPDGRMEYHIAQYNIAKLVAPLDDPRIADFVAAIDPLNRLADESAGFVWRHQTEEGNSTAVRVRGDPMILINFSVWESVEALFEYAYHSDHVMMYRRRRDFFEHMGLPYLVLWWIPAGHIPSVREAEERLDYLREHGPTERAFTFKRRFPPPSE